jgi:hypothetical protein
MEQSVEHQLGLSGRRIVQQCTFRRSNVMATTPSSLQI